MSKGTQSVGEQDRRFERTLRNLLSTPHKPHERGKKPDKRERARPQETAARQVQKGNAGRS